MPREIAFTQAEQQKLRKLYPTALLSELLAAFPGRTLKQIRGWAATRGLRRDTDLARKRAARPPGRPRKSEAGTPVLDAQLRARRQMGAPGAIAQMVEQMKKLPGSHPRRLAYAEAARHGSGLDALEAWYQWPKRQPKAVQHHA